MTLAAPVLENEREKWFTLLEALSVVEWLGHNYSTEDHPFLACERLNISDQSSGQRGIHIDNTDTDEKNIWPM